MPATRRRIVIVLAVGSVLVASLVLLSIRRGGEGAVADGGAAPATMMRATSSIPIGTSTPPTSESPGGAPVSAPPGPISTTAPASAPAAPRTPPTTAPVPLNLSASQTSGLRDGSLVRIQVTPTPGSQAFGFEAFLCKGGVDFTLDADIRPDETGKCISKPLSAGSDDYKLVAAAPPYQVAEAEFRVGVGTDSFVLRDGRTASITCGPGNPCQIVLKLQYPGAYGFRTIPVTYG